MINMLLVKANVKLAKLECAGKNIKWVFMPFYPIMDVILNSYNMYLVHVILVTT